MQIGIVAKRIGLSVDAIRFYERNGLLPHPPRTEVRFPPIRRQRCRYPSVYSASAGLGLQT